MINANDSSKVIFLPASAGSAAQYMSFDAKGFDQANIEMIFGSYTTTTAIIAAMKLSESDTVTSASSMTDIVAFTGTTNTVTDATCGFVIPAVATSGGGGAVEFQVDLRKRKRYIGLTYTGSSSQTSMCAAMARLSRAESSCDTAAQKTTSNKAATNVTGCFKVVAG